MPSNVRVKRAGAKIAIRKLNRDVRISWEIHMQKALHHPTGTCAEEPSEHPKRADREHQTEKNRAELQREALVD